LISIFPLTEGSRCCYHHFKDNDWEILRTKATKNDYSAAAVDDIIQNLRGVILNDKSLFNFEFIEDMDENLVSQWIGINISQFTHMLSLTPSLHENEKKHKNTVFAALLAKLKFG